MTAAIFGLVGVLIGGLLNGVIAWLAEHRKLRGELKVAARMAVSDLNLSRAAIKYAFQISNVDGFSCGSVSEWRKHRATLAMALTGTEWSNVDNCFQVIEQTIAEAKDGAAWNEESQAHLHSVNARSIASLEVLSRLSGTPVPAENSELPLPPESDSTAALR